MSALPKLHWKYPEAAEALGVEESYLRHNIKALPHRKPNAGSQYVLFSEADLREISESWAVRPERSAPVSVPAGLLTLRPRGARVS